MNRSFDRKVLTLLAGSNSVRIETKSANGAVHKTTIWVVVDAATVYVRSYRGRRARWFREIRARRDAALLLRGIRIPVHAVLVRSPQAIARASKVYLKKYAKSPYAKEMVRREILFTTLRLEPV